VRVLELFHKYREQKRLSRAKRSRVVEVTATFGTILAFKDDLITHQIREFGAHTRPEVAFLLSVLEDGDRVFDIGAHIGTFAIPMAQKIYPSGRLLAVEGDAANFDLLVQNIARNGLSEVVNPRHALIAPAGSAYSASYVNKNTSGTFFVANTGSQTIPQYSLDELAAAAFQPDVIKIDIEGMECLALSDSSMVAERKPILYVEVSESHLSRYGGSIGSLDSMLRKLDYRLFRNVAPRNAANDHFEARELSTLAEGGAFFDVLALPPTSPRLARLTL
jgi:FkbM family methyltransferase